MAIITGELLDVGTPDVMFDPVHSTVVIKCGSDVVASGVINAAHRFEIEIPDDIEGELELVSSIRGAAPVVFETGGDVELTVLVNRGGSIAAV